MDTRVVEIRTYRLRPGKVEGFVETMRSRALPLLAAHGIDVLACGASLDPDDQDQPDAYLIRAFGSLAERAQAEASFYGSADWIDGPRADVLAPILDFHTVVLELAAVAAEQLRRVDG